MLSQGNKGTSHTCSFTFLFPVPITFAVVFFAEQNNVAVLSRLEFLSSCLSILVTDDGKRASYRNFSFFFEFWLETKYKTKENSAYLENGIQYCRARAVICCCATVQLREDLWTVWVASAFIWTSCTGIRNQCQNSSKLTYFYNIVYYRFRCVTHSLLTCIGWSQIRGIFGRFVTFSK